MFLLSNLVAFKNNLSEKKKSKKDQKMHTKESKHMAHSVVSKEVSKHVFHSHN